jgi:hypothetical protein
MTTDRTFIARSTNTTAIRTGILSRVGHIPDTTRIGEEPVPGGGATFSAAIPFCVYAMFPPRSHLRVFCIVMGDRINKKLQLAQVRSRSCAPIRRTYRIGICGSISATKQPMSKPRSRSRSRRARFFCLGGLMRHAVKYNPEWSYLAPAPNLFAGGSK